MNLLLKASPQPQSLSFQVGNACFRDRLLIVATIAARHVALYYGYSENETMPCYSHVDRPCYIGLSEIYIAKHHMLVQCL